MRSINFVAPDGRKGKITAPDDWSSERIQSEVDTALGLSASSSEAKPEVPLVDQIPGSPNEASPPKPKDEMSWLGANATGAFKGVRDLAGGVNQNLAKILQIIPSDTTRGLLQEWIDYEAKSAKEREKSAKKAHVVSPVMSRMAEAIPGMAVGAAIPVVRGMGAFSNVLNSAGAGGVFAGMTTPVTEPDKFASEKAKQIGMGAALSGGITGIAEAGKKVLPEAWKYVRSLPFAPGRDEFLKKQADDIAARTMVAGRRPGEVADAIEANPAGPTLPEATGAQKDLDIYAKLKGHPQGAVLAEREQERLKEGIRGIQRTLPEGGVGEAAQQADRYAQTARQSAASTVNRRAQEAEAMRRAIGQPMTPSAIGETIQGRMQGRNDVLTRARERSAVAAAGGDEAWQAVRQSQAPDLSPVRTVINDMINRSGNSREKNILNRVLGELEGDTREVPLSTDQIKDLFRRGGQLRAQGDEAGGMRLIEDAMRGTRIEAAPFTVEKLDSFRRALNEIKVPGSTEAKDRLTTRDAQRITNAVRELFPSDHPYRRFLAEFERGSRPLDPFRTARGKYALRDEYGVLVNDAHTVAERYLGAGSRDAAVDLVNAWGGRDPQLDGLVRSYVASKMTGKSAAQIDAFAREKAGMLEVFPEARQAMQEASEAILRAERAAAGLRTLEASLASKSDPIGLLSSKNAQEAMKTILTGANSDAQVASLSRRIGKTPEGKAAIRGAARDVLLADQTPEAIIQNWGKMRSNIVKSGAMSFDQARAIDTIVKDFEGLQLLATGRASRGDVLGEIRHIQSGQKAMTAGMQAMMILAKVPWGRAWSIKQVANADISKAIEDMTPQVRGAMIDMMMNPDLAARAARRATEKEASSLAQELAARAQSAIRLGIVDEVVSP